MAKPLISLIAIGAISTLSACGGGGGGNNLAGYLSGFSAIQNDTTLATPTLDTTVNDRNGNATYNGVINVSMDPAGSPYGTHAYYGGVTMTVNFNNATTNDVISGSASDFILFGTFGFASPETGNAVPGSLSITGNLTGDNSFTNGIAATAIGNIHGVTAAFDVDGNINGVNGNGMSLSLSGTNSESNGGVALLIE